MKLAIAAAAALICGAGVAMANPAIPPGGPLGVAPNSLIQMVHGCHRFAQDDMRGWHRHVGPNCRRVAADPTQQNPYARCRTKCNYVGPIKECRRVCD